MTFSGDGGRQLKFGVGRGGGGSILGWENFLGGGGGVMSKFLAGVGWG